MATITGPLHSDAAAGTLAGQITYRRTRRGFAATRYSKPGSVNPFTPSPPQALIRAITKSLMQMWPTITEEHRATWTALAESRDIQPINCFLMENYRLTRSGQMPTTVWPPQPAMAHIVITGGQPPEDALGFYQRIENINDLTAYRLIAVANWTIFYFPPLFSYVLTETESPSNPLHLAVSDGPVEGPYTFTDDPAATVRLSFLPFPLT